MTALAGNENEQRLSAVVSSFLQSIDEGQRSTYRQETNRFMRWFGSARPITDVGALDLERYQEEVAASKADRKHASDALRALFSFARQEGFIASNPARNLRQIKSGQATGGPRVEAPPAVQLSEDGLEKLRVELETLRTVRLPQIMDDLRRAAADKDLRENAPYDAAKQEKAHIEGRIKELEEVLKRAVLMEKPAVASERVALGSTVTLIEMVTGDEVTYSIVHPREASPLKGRISTESAVGKAVFGHEAGDEVEAQAPIGTVRYRIKHIGVS